MEKNYVRHELEIQPETTIILLDGNLLLYTKKKTGTIKTLSNVLATVF